eukprot:403361113
MAQLDQSKVSKKRRPLMNTFTAMSNPDKLRKINKIMKQEALTSIDKLWESESPSLRNKFFFLDHTAEVLENYRKIKENEIFTQILHDEREKKAFLRRESKKVENLIENYEQKYGHVKYLQGTDNPSDISHLAASADLFLENTEIMKKHNVVFRNPSQVAKQLNEGAKQPQMIEHNEFKEYKTKQKEIQNFRIQKLLTPRTNNPDLQKYLEDKASYETASLGETSADELALKSNQSDENSDKSVDIYRENRLASEFDHLKNVAAQIEQYEEKVIEEYKNLDVYRAKNKSFRQINFNDLTLQENLNYIKFNLKNSAEAFQMFEQVKDKFANHPEIATSIVQKLALKSNIKKKDVNAKLLQKYEYKNLLRHISKNLDMLDNKQSVDTIFSLGKLHKGMNLQEIETGAPGFYKFFNYFIRDLFQDVESRIKELSPIQVAYLTKGISDLKKVQNPQNQELEIKLREQIKQYAITNAANFDPYSISKIVRYLYTFNDGSEASIKAYEALGMKLYSNLQDRRKAMREMALDDPLIDLDMKDVVDIIRVYSVYAKPEQQLFVPQLFFEETKEADGDSSQLNQLQPSALGANQPKIENLYQLSRAILSDLPDIIRRKESEISVAQISDIMYHYTSAEVMQNKSFIYYLHKLADEQIMVHEKFVSNSTAKLLWGFGKFVNRKLQPRFNMDISASVINRYEFTKTPSVNYQLNRRVIDMLLTKKKIITPENVAITLYANASVGYHDKIFFTDAYAQFTENGQVPSIENMGYFAQTLALLRKNEFVEHVFNWLESMIIAKNQEFFDKSGYNIAKEFSFTQTLQALSYLDCDKLRKSETIMNFLDTYLKSLEIEMTAQHMNLIPSILWSLMAVGKLDQQHRLLKQSLEIIVNEKLSVLSFSDCVLMNQIFNQLISKQGYNEEGVMGLINKDQRNLFLQLAVRQDQIELKSNINYYKKTFGEDIVYTLIQDLKFMSFEGDFEIETYNPIRGGYQQLVDITFKDTDRQKETLILMNKFDRLSESNQVNTFEKIRRMQMISLIEKEGRIPVFIDYSDIGLIYKSSLSKEDFRQKIRKNILSL